MSGTDPRISHATLDRLASLVSLFEQATESLFLADAAFDDCVADAASAFVDGCDAAPIIGAAELAATQLDMAEDKVRRIGLLVARLSARVARAMPPVSPRAGSRS